MTRTIGALETSLTELLFEAGPRSVLVVEGESDRGVLQIWVGNRQDRLLLHAAGEKEAVGALVREARKVGGVRVHGLVDRDYTPDDAYAAEPEPGVRVLERHELENYLVEPEAISAEKGVLDAPRPAPPRDETAAQIDGWVRDASARVAANWILAPEGRTLLPDSGLEPREAVVRHLADELGISEADAQTRLAAMEAAQLPVLKDPSARHTVVEGKRLLHRCLHVYFRGIAEDRVRNLLARAAGPPDEVAHLIGRLLGEAS